MAARLTAYIVAAIVGATIVAGLIVGAQRADENEPADLLIYNAKVYTADGTGRVAEAVAVKGNRILRVGSNRDVRRLARRYTVQIDARGGTVLPGFTDAHAHLMAGGLGLDQVDLLDAVTLEEVRAKIRAFAAAHPDRPWVLGRGWYYALFPGGLPTRQLLDALVPDRPAHLVAYDGHTAWVNTRALRLAGITRRTPNPPDGVIVRDPRTGDPTGVLKEGARALMERVLPPVSREDRLRALRRAIREAHRVGVTSVHDLGATEDDLALFDELRRTGELTVRVYAAVPVGPTFDEAQALGLEALRRQYGDETLLRMGAAKLMLDGVVEAHTAALAAPYATRRTRGLLRFTPERLARVVSLLDQRGWQVIVHAIGDKAVRLALDAFAGLPPAREERRHRIEHVEVLDPADVPRFARLGVVASMQPFHGNPAPYQIDIWRANLGPERAARGWLYGSIRRAGGRVAFGSDWPVAPLDPRYGLHVATTRTAPDGTPEGGWQPEERLPLAAAIDAYTREAAYAAFDEPRTGAIVPGRLADLVVFSTDLFSLPPGRLLEAAVDVTVFDGKIVYTRPRERETTEP